MWACFFCFFSCLSSNFFHFFCFINLHMLVNLVIFHQNAIIVQSTLVILNSKGLTETLRDIRTLTYQS